jgi:hypothetical protein
MHQQPLPFMLLTPYTILTSTNKHQQEINNRSFAIAIIGNA